MLATIAWNTTKAPTGGDWDFGDNWVGGIVPKTGDVASITGLNSASVVYLDSNASTSIRGLITDAKTTLQVLSGTLGLSAGSSSTLAGPMLIGAGATMTVGSSSSLTINAQTLTDSGTLTFGTGCSVLFSTSFSAPSGIVVNGVMNATGSTFTGGNANYTAAISVAPNGRLKASGNTFSITQVSLDDGSVVNPGDLTGNTFNAALALPYNDLQYLANNTAFNAININAGTLSTGVLANDTLALDAIGANTSKLSYVFPAGFTIASGTTVNVAANVKLVIPAGQTLAVKGAMNMLAGDSVEFGYSYGSTTSIRVTGTLNAAGTTFYQDSASNTTQVAVGPSGHLLASGSTFAITQVTLDDGSVLNANDLSGNTFNTTLALPYRFVPYLTNNTVFNAISINAGTLSTGVLVNDTLALSAIGANTSKLSYVFPAGFTIASGTTVNVAANVKLVIPAGQTLAVKGAMNMLAGDSVEFGYSYGSTTSIRVTGTLNAAGTTFYQDSASNTTQVAVGPSGHLLASGSTFSITQVTLDDGSVLNANDLSGNTFNATLALPYRFVPYLTNNTSFNAIDINAGTLSTGVLPGNTLALGAIGANTSNLSYVFPGGFTIASGTTVNVAANVKLVISAGQTLAVNGTMNMLAGDSVEYTYSYGTTSSITVAGTLNAVGTTFYADSASNTTQVAVGPNGHLLASGSTFTITQVSLDSGSVLNATDLIGNTFNNPLYLPYRYIQYLANNIAFNAIGINAGTLSIGVLPGNTLTLNAIGVNTSKLSYLFSGNFTIASGTTVNVAPYVKIALAPGTTIATQGTMNLVPGDTVEYQYAYGTAPTIAVTGILNAAGTTFIADSTSNTTQIVANYGGLIRINSSTIDITGVVLNSGSSAILSQDVLSGNLTINAGANVGGINSPTITGNDFTGVAAKGVIAVGDSTAKIPLSGNYWGTTVPSEIDAKILDHNDDATRPTIVYSPYVSGTSGTSANPATITYSPTDQTINLSATVTTTGGVPIDEGTETFTLWYGTTLIGQATAAANVSHGNVSATYTIPAGTPAGQYIIEADYLGSSKYLPSVDRNHFLTINPAATVTTTTNAAATFSGVSDQTIALSAHVSSTAGAVDEGIVTFTVFSGGNPVGSPVIGNVSAGASSATYTLLKGTPGGSYTIKAVYTDPVNFSTSTGTNALAVAAAPTAVAPTAASATYNKVSGEGLTLSATVTSAAGTINEGSVAFTFLDGGGSPIGSTAYLAVANGVATGNAFLPAGTVPGSYTIKAVYNGTASYATSLPVTSTLAVNGAGTITTAANASIPVGVAAQAVTLAAVVTSGGSPVNEGTVTFTVMKGAAIVGTATAGSVSAGNASVSYTLPAGTAAGTYTIQAVFSDPSNYLGSSDLIHTLTVTQPPATKLVLHTQPSGIASAGQAFGVQPVIYAEDANGNVVTGDNSTVVTVALATGSGPLQGTLTATVVGGIATFANLGDLKAETITLLFTSGNLASVTSDPIVVSPAAGTKLVVTQQPSATATAAQVFAVQPVVMLEDQYGNVIAGDSTHTVTVARGTNGTSTLKGNNLTVTLVNGVATFSGLSYNKAEVMNLSFTTNAAGVVAASSSNITVSPTTASQIVMGQQPSATATAGVVFATQPIVYIEDPYGNLVSSDNSTQVKVVPGSGVGPLQGPTTVTVVGGVATFTGLGDTTAETLTLKFSSGPLNSATSNPIVVGAAAAVGLRIDIEPYENVVAGTPLTDPIVVSLVDQYGNIVTSDNSSVVTASMATGGGTLRGTLTAKAVAGVASFDDLENDTAGTLTLQFTAGTLPPVFSRPSVVTAAPAKALKITTRPPGGIIAGRKFSVTVEANDQFGNVDPSFNGPVTVGLAPGSTGSLGGTVTVNAANGVATFANLVSTTSGSIALVASNSGLTTSASSGSIPVDPSTPAGFAIRTQPSASAVAGAAFAIQPVVTEVDEFGNVITSDSTTVVTALIGTGAGPLQGTTTATLKNGVATFANLAANVAGTITLQFAGPGLGSPVTSPITIKAAAASKLAIHVQPSASATAGQAFGTQPVVYILDPYDNLVADDSKTVVTAALASGAGPLQGTTSVTAVGGVASFTNLADNLAETITLRFTAGSFTAGPSTTTVISAAAAAKLVIHTQPSQAATAGVAFGTQPVVYELDAYNNRVTADSSTVVTALVAGGAGPLSGTLTATVSAGIATFSGLAANTAGTITLAFVAGAMTSAASVPIVISPAAPSKLVFATQPAASAAAGVAFPIQPVLHEVDAFGNLVTTDNATSVLARIGSGAGPLRGTTSVTIRGGVATFTDLADNAAGPITLTFTAGGLSSPASSPITINPGPAASLTIQRQPSTSAASGVAFAIQPVIAELDAYGNLVTTDSTTAITATLSAGAGPLLGTTTVVMKGGLATFTDLADASPEENITLGFSGGGLSTGPSAGLSVTSPPPSKLVIHAQPSGSATAGVAFGTQPVVYVEDAYGNLVVNDNTTMVTVTLASGAGPLLGTTTVTARGGIATFTNLSDNVAGTLSLVFTSGSLTAATSSGVAVRPGPAAKLEIVQQPSGSAVAGQAFATQPVVYLEDAFGNLEVDDSSTVVTAVLASGGGPLQGPTSVAVSGGVARFSGLADASGETASLRFVAGGISSAPTGAIVIAAPLPVVVGVARGNGKLIKNGKATKTSVPTFTIAFSTAVNAALFGNPGYYSVSYYTNAKLKPKAIKVQSATVSGNTVVLTLGAAQKFKYGGTIALNAALGVRNSTIAILKGGGGGTAS